VVEKEEDSITRSCESSSGQWSGSTPKSGDNNDVVAFGVVMDDDDDAVSIG
jgi:hypothetical protein